MNAFMASMLEAFAILLRVLLVLSIVVLCMCEWAAPRLARLSNPVRRRIGRRLRRSFRSARLTPVRTMVFTLVLGLIGLNGMVRLTGGRPGWLSTDHVQSKFVALVRLAAHLAFHPFGSCGASKDDLLLEAAERHKLPFALVRAVAETESGFRPHVISHAGAMGVMQLMPTTASLMDVSDPFDARENIDGGTRYLAQQYRRYKGDIRRTAAAYHAGPGRVPVKGQLRVGNATRRYMRVINERTLRYARKRQAARDRS